MSSPDTIRYTTWGPVRGDCGHLHRSLGTAQRCAAPDARACASLGGGAYSDRGVRELDAEDVARWGATYGYDVQRGPGRAAEEVAGE